MNSVRDFASWRPEVSDPDREHLDRIWSDVVRNDHDRPEPSSIRAGTPDPSRVSHVDGESSRGSSGEFPPESARPRRLVAAAAAIVAVVGVGALVAVQTRDDTGAGAVLEQPEPDPSTGTAMPDDWESFTAMPIPPRFQHAAVSTGEGLFVWGGYGDEQGFSDGAYFDGSAWRVVPDAPLQPGRGDAVAAWTGDEVVVVNGIEGVQAAAFDPVSFSWRSLATPDSEAANSAQSRLLAFGTDRLALARPEAMYLYEIPDGRWSTFERTTGSPGTETTRGFAAVSQFAAILTTSSDMSSCGENLALHVFDTEQRTWSSIALDAPDVAPVDLAPLPDGRLLVVGRSCSSLADESAPGSAFAVSPESGETTRLADPPGLALNAGRYGGLAVDDSVVYLAGRDGSLVAYQPASNTWTIGDPLIPVPTTAISETPLLGLDDRVVMVSPGYATVLAGGSSECCEPRNESWISDLPTTTYVPPSAEAATPDTTTGIDTTGRSPALLVVDPPPDGYQLTEARLQDGGGLGIARYTTPSSTTELQIVIRDFPLPIDTLESLDRVTWQIGERTVWSDGELEGCLPDFCSIGLQWDEHTYLSLTWVEPDAGNLAPGSTQESLLDLIPTLVEDETQWQTAPTGPDEAYPAEPRTEPGPPYGGRVFVSNANTSPGSAGRLTALLADAGFNVTDAVNATAASQADSTIYVDTRGGCVASQIMNVLTQLGADDVTWEAMPSTIPIDEAGAERPNVLVELGNDIGDLIASNGIDLNLITATPPPGNLVVVDGTGAPDALGDILNVLAAQRIVPTTVLEAAQPAAETTLHPLSDPTLWTCAVADAADIGGFDEWTPTIISGQLPDDADLVLVVGR